MSCIIAVRAVGGGEVAAPPLLVRHHQRERDVLVGVGGGVVGAPADRRSAGVVVPAQEALVARAAPARVATARQRSSCRACRRPSTSRTRSPRRRCRCCLSGAARATGAGADDVTHLVEVPPSLHVGVVAVRRVAAIGRQPVLRKRIVGAAGGRGRGLRRAHRHGRGPPAARRRRGVARPARAAGLGPEWAKRNRPRCQAAAASRSGGQKLAWGLRTNWNSENHLLSSTRRDRQPP